jgi:hypothetical protein
MCFNNVVTDMTNRDVKRVLEEACGGKTLGFPHGVQASEVAEPLVGQDRIKLSSVHD